MMRRVLVLTAALVVILGIALVALSWDQWKPPAASDESPPDGLSAFYQQKLDWNECGPSHCTWVKVPVDYTDPSGATLQLRVKLTPARDDKPRGKLFLNPGGPGGSGVEYLPLFVGQASSEVRDSYDFIGFDPRGVGSSTPLECLPDKEFDTYTNLDPDPDDEAEIAAARAATRELGEACAQNGGDLASHVSTLEAAKDIDILRALVGEKKLSYYGASYGTQLGATYAELFPSRVGRMILDGAVDASLDDRASSLGQAEGFERALDAYVAFCTAKRDCPLGTDPEGAKAKISDFIGALDANPMKSPKGRLLTEGAAFYGLVTPLYSEANWPILTAGLQGAFKGDPTIMLALFDTYFGRQPDGTYKDNSGEVITAVRCLDSTGASTVEQVKASFPEFEKVSPTFGRVLAWGALGCQDWPLEAEGTQQVEISAKGAAPILVVGTTRDPATPYEWAEALADQLESGVLVTRAGDGHTGYHAGNSCIDDILDAYLLKDTVPENGVKCADPND